MSKKVNKQNRSSFKDARFFAHRLQGACLCVGALVLFVACGPKLQNDQDDVKSKQRPDKSFNLKSPVDKAQSTLLERVENTLTLRSFDASDWFNSNQSSEQNLAELSISKDGVTAVADSLSEERSCGQIPELGITTVIRKWTGQLANARFLSSGTGPSMRTETWSRSSSIECSEQQWAKVGWQSASNLVGLKQKVALQINIARDTGSRTTETFTSGERVFDYEPTGYVALSEGTFSFKRTLVIGSEALPNAVKVVLKEGQTEVRRTTGFVHTAPASPIVETVTRSLGDKPSVLGRTIESGVLLTTQPDGTKLTTTISQLVYKGRKTNGSFSCVPVSGSITDDIVLTTGENLLVKREIVDGSLTLTTTCRKGVSVEVCSELIQNSLRKSLTPYCLY